MRPARFSGVAAAILGWALAVPALAQGDAGADDALAQTAPKIEELFERTLTEAHVPALVYGIVRDGKLVVFAAMGDRDVGTAGIEPVDADTRFRIASMSKAFTAAAILKLRDEGWLSLEDPAAKYVPQMRQWRQATPDAPAITIGDLLRHTGGFVEDNPWGDRQQVLSEDAFTQLIAGGMDFATTPGTAYEYSNYGYALLGRIVTNVSGRRYQDYIRQEIMLPLGMTSTGYDVLASPPESRAIGYRWEKGAYRREPDMADGAFGAMGGVETTANDYAKWMIFLLSAWPPSNAPDTGPLRRASVREMVKWVTPREGIERPADLGPPCRVGVGYGMGLVVYDDCQLGRIVQHNGGYPGYGSTMQLLPEAGVGMFSFNARTYFSNAAGVRKALHMLRDAGAAPDRALPVAAGLAEAYALAVKAWDSGDPLAAPLAVNVALDRDIADRKADIAALKQEVGPCDTGAAIAPISAMEGTFEWSCEKGAVRGRIQRAPTVTIELQVLDFARKP
ncbi:serine hydrolase domain-containing protein [Parerythrobacter aurantius]|uniref:serine hydrolase domain-containing protein n=1 Tax=Parerythrobacter aurantius TaxID=3127706 RepID=UPI00324EEDE8